MKLLQTALIMFALIATTPVVASLEEQHLIRSFLEGIDAGDLPQISGRTLMQPELLVAVYRSREHKPIWVEDGSLANQRDGVLTAISESVGHGFIAERYHRDAIEQLRGANDDGSLLALELLLTDAFISQALHRGRGAVFPPNLDAEWQVPQADVDAGSLLLETARKRRSVTDALTALWPQAEDYRLLLNKRTEIAASGDTVTVQVPRGPLLKPGQSNDRVILLKERLLGPGEHSPLFDGELQREVVAFQTSAGLEPDGLVGDGTLEVMNATQVSWVDRIDANLERWRWLPRETPETYLRVNIAAYTLRAITRGDTELAMKVIIGKPYRRTPVFTETIKYLVLNPSWNVPFSIATKDKLPLLQANAVDQAGKGFEAKLHGSDIFVPVDAVDWRGVTPRNFNYLLRQQPGPNNALGRIKFMLPNPFAVYLHDTPSRELFARQERSFSSGCVRLEHPVQLAEWLLAREKNPYSGQIEQLLHDDSTQTIYLKKPMPTQIVYFTAFTSDDGDVIFRRDIYSRDAMLIDALKHTQS